MYLHVSIFVMVHKCKSNRKNARKNQEHFRASDVIALKLYSNINKKFWNTANSNLLAAVKFSRYLNVSPL